MAQSLFIFDGILGTIRSHPRTYIACANATQSPFQLRDNVGYERP